MIMLLIMILVICMAASMAQPADVKAQYNRAADEFIRRHIEPPCKVLLVAIVAGFIGIYTSRFLGYGVFGLGFWLWIWRPSMRKPAAPIEKRKWSIGDVAEIGADGLRFPPGTPVKVMREGRDMLLVSHAHSDNGPAFGIRIDQL